MSGLWKKVSPFEAWEYDRVDSQDESSKESITGSYTTLPRQRSNGFLRLTLTVVILLLTLSFGFLAGRHLPPLFQSDFLMGTFPAHPALKAKLC